MSLHLYAPVLRACVNDALTVLDADIIASAAGVTAADLTHAATAPNVITDDHAAETIVRCAGISRLAVQAYGAADAAELNVPHAEYQHRSALDMIAAGGQNLIDVILHLSRLTEPARDATWISDDRWMFTEGDCHHLAFELHNLTGFPICAFATRARPDHHAFVQLPDGRYLDIDGISEPDVLRKRWGYTRIMRFDWPLLDWVTHLTWCHDQEFVRDIAADLLTAHNIPATAPAAAAQATAA